MMMKLSFWLTLIFLVSVIYVWGGSVAGYLPPLHEIGSTAYGLELSLFWLIGLVAMIIHILGMLYTMIRARHWFWLVASLLLAPLTTLYYYWFVVRKHSTS